VGTGAVDAVVEVEVVTLLLASSFSGGWWSPTCSECPAVSLALALLLSLSLLLLLPSSSLLLSSDAQATAVITSEDSAVDEPSSSPSSGSASCMDFK
jgi:hypothetical protein